MRIQGKGNSHSLLVGSQNYVTTMEISIEKFQSRKSRSVTYDPPITLCGICLKDFTSYSTDTNLAMFIVTPLTTAKKWKQPTCPMLTNG